MSKVSENQSGLDETNKIIKDIEGDIFTINRLLKVKLSNYGNYVSQISYIKDNIKK